MKKLSVIIPVYNEEKTIEELIKRVKRVEIPKQIIIVDDFSQDRTREILKRIEKKDVVLIFHEKNYGKGYAIRNGLKEADGDIVIIQDGDLEYDPNDYLKVIEPIANNRAKVVYGNRFSNINKSSLIKNKFLLGNKVLTIIANILYNANINDEATCYKAFDADVLKKINLKCKGFEFCPEITAKIRKRGIKIHEVPINYNPRTLKQGKKIRIRDGIVAIWTLIKYRF